MGVLPAESCQDNADLLFGGILTVGDTLDIPDKVPGFLCPGFSLPDPVHFLGDNPAPFSRYFTSSQEQVQVPECPLLYVFNVSHFPKRFTHCLHKNLSCYLAHHAAEVHFVSFGIMRFHFLATEDDSLLLLTNNYSNTRLQVTMHRFGLRFPQKFEQEQVLIFYD